MGRHRDAAPLTTAQRVGVGALAVLAFGDMVLGVVLLAHGRVFLGAVDLLCGGALVTLLPARLSLARTANHARRPVTRLTGQPAGKRRRWWASAERGRVDQDDPPRPQNGPGYADLTERIRQRRNGGG